ncbi:rhomboid-domain-containing protein [Violaceomyces palustris]|uniref:Rhomboid-domain-containing protein n=1 Tax=Violaceomyces palustris TaxID=1673888 RepID=A0ACD0P8E0_9BASI|nr:rhomboid-domain-containing protein [Violaceomyces palustris]
MSTHQHQSHSHSNSGGYSGSFNSQPPNYSDEPYWDPSPYKSQLEAYEPDLLSPVKAGVGAGSNAYKQSSAVDNNYESSPSMYTDNFEVHSTAPPNIVSTRPPESFLQADPYARGDVKGATGLSRSDTLGPYDSISSYNVPIVEDSDPAPDRSSTGHQYSKGGGNYNRASYHQPEASFDETADYHNYPRNYYGSSGAELPLKSNAGAMGYAEDEDDEVRQMSGKDGAGLFSNQMNEVHGRKSFTDEVEDRSGLLSKLSGPRGGFGKNDKIEDQIEKRRRGIGRQRWPVVSYLVAVALVAVFIVELVKSSSETGQAVQTRPSINPMLGPPSEFLISFGARFVPCMRSVPNLSTTENLPCLNASTSATNSYTADQLCPIWEICGLKDASSPNQGYRFVSAIFVHAGFIHIGFNLLVQLTLCAQIEKLLGSIAYSIIYFAGGIGGNLLGGNFGLIGQPALGASGAIYTCISVELIDLVYNWQYEYRAKTRLFVSLVFAAIGLGLGLLPGLDNFSHIGGFCVGLLGGLIFAPAIHPTKKHRIICWILRVVALALLVGFFVGLTTNFYNNPDPLQACTWCRYLSCLPVFNSCKGNGLITTTSTN